MDLVEDEEATVQAVDNGRLLQEGCAEFLRNCCDLTNCSEVEINELRSAFHVGCGFMYRALETILSAPTETYEEDQARLESIRNELMAYAATQRDNEEDEGEYIAALMNAPTEGNA